MTHRKATYPILFVLLLCLVMGQARGAEPATAAEAALKSYYNTCAAQVQSSKVLLMCDTLAQRAQAAKNGRFTVLATMLRLEHYYYKNDKEKVIDYVTEVKRLSRYHNQPDYYYFAWGSRLIMFYLKNGMSNQALFEAQQMLREAQAENYTQGIIECYKALGNIYTTQSNPRMAADYYRRLLEMVEKYDPEDVNIPTYYSMLSAREMTNGNLDAAEEALKKIETYFAKADTVTPYQRLSVDRGLLQLYLRKNDTARAQHIFERIEHAFTQHGELAVHNKALFEARMLYYSHTRQFVKALAMIDSLRKTNPNAEMTTFLLAKKGEISWALNDMSTAAACFRDYITLTDSVRQASAQHSANELAGLLNLQQLEKDKQLLEVDIQQRRLQTTYRILGILALALTVGIVMMLRLARLNRQLRETKQQILRQNAALETAKIKAEEASLMKSRFIQDISHEVRTPLNAIVGFSHVVSELCVDHVETQEYAEIIATNSDHLLRLFNDVLELSSLDEIKRLSYDTPTELHTPCRQTIEQVRTQLQPGVTLHYISAESDLQILSNTLYVPRILSNLLHNAAKFTEHGSITLDCSICADTKTIRYTVTDTGSGIPATMYDTLFDRFKKANSFSQGTGLGLALCRTVAEKMGGTLIFDTTYTGGSRFVLTLPLQYPDSITA